MKKNLLLSVALVAVFALSGTVLTSCGGGGGSDSENNSLPTDGILGTFPQKYFDCIDAIGTARTDLGFGTAEEKEAASKKMPELMAQLEKLAAAENISSVEIPTEIAAGIPFKVVKPFVITETKEQLTLQAGVESTEAVDEYKAYNYGYIIAYDTDGKPFAIGQQGTYRPEGNSNNWQAGSKGTMTVYMALAPFNFSGLARIGKLLIVTPKSEEMNQAKTSISEMQSAAIAKRKDVQDKLLKK